MLPDLEMNLAQLLRLSHENTEARGKIELLEFPYLLPNQTIQSGAKLSGTRRPHPNMQGDDITTWWWLHPEGLGESP